MKILRKKCNFTYLGLAAALAAWYNVAMHKHDYYNQFFELGQQKINFKFYELSLSDDDPVFTLKNVMEEMDFTALLAQYSGKGKREETPSRTSGEEKVPLLYLL